MVQNDESSSALASTETGNGKQQDQRRDGDDGPNEANTDSRTADEDRAADDAKRSRKRRRKNKDKRPQWSSSRKGESEAASFSSGIEVQYVSGAPLLAESSPLFEQFHHVFARFGKVEDLFVQEEQDKPVQHDEDQGDQKQEGDEQEDRPRRATTAAEAAAAAAAELSADKEDAAADKTLSKRKRKLMNRLSISELKQLVNRSDIVEPQDVCALDPRLLIHLKSYRNTVPVPRHWKDKRRYLQSRRTLDKPPFQLPEFIAHTGIQKIRDSYKEQEDKKKSKQKQRERMQPKQGKMDVDYQVLHDAFFKFQTKPRLSRYGDLYYEGKEYEARMKDVARPGHIGPALRQALGMPPTGTAPPPWLINMQRYGLPPSYPSLRVPGVNAPIPQGAQWGYQPGGWGRPPVDPEGRPLYGDVFNTEGVKASNEFDHPIETGHWGELEPDEEVEEEVEEEAEPTEEVVEMPPPEMMGQVPMATDGTLSVTSISSGISSIPMTGIETPEVIGLRKRRYPGD